MPVSAPSVRTRNIPRVLSYLVTKCCRCTIFTVQYSIFGVARRRIEGVPARYINRRQTIKRGDEIHGPRIETMRARARRCFDMGRDFTSAGHFRCAAILGDGGQQYAPYTHTVPNATPRKRTGHHSRLASPLPPPRRIHAARGRKHVRRCRPGRSPLCV